MGVKDWERIVAQTHEINLFAEVLTFRGLDAGLPALPVETLTWTVDATARPALNASLRVPLVPEWTPTSSYSPLTPWGNQVEVWAEIRGGQNQFAKCRLGFGLISKVEMRRPEHAIDITLVDATDVLMNSHTRKALPVKGDKDLTDWQWFEKIVDDGNLQMWERDSDGVIIEPYREGIRLSDPGERISRTHKIGADERWSPGMSRMSILDELCQRQSWNPSWLYPNRNGTLVVRAPALLEETQVPTHGTVYVLSGGEGGTLMSVTTSLIRDGAINELTVRNDAPKLPNRISTYHITSGAMKRSRVGKRNTVEERSKNWTQAELDSYTSYTLRLRAGVQRQASIRAVINPHYEAGQIVETYLDGARERWMARSVSFDFPSGIMTITGQGYVDESLQVAKGNSPVPIQDPVSDAPAKVSSPGEVDEAKDGRYPSAHRFKSVERALNDGKGTTTSVKNAVAVLRLVAEKYKGISVVGGWRRSDPYPDHPSGLALDLMMNPSDYSTKNRKYGDSIVRYLIKNQKRFAIDYIIWRQRIWSGSYGNLNYKRSRAMKSRGSITANHKDHIHVLCHPYKDFSGRWTAVKRGTYWNKPSTTDAGKGFVTPMKDMIYRGGNTYRLPGHPGVDYGTTGNGNLKVIADGGKISKVVTSNGNMVFIDYKLPGGTLTTRYYHMKHKSRYPVGRKLSRGTVVGEMGNTGNSRGAHLHFETHFNGNVYNPLEIMKALRAPIGGPSHGASLGTARMESLRRMMFKDKNWRPVTRAQLYPWESAP